MPNISLSASAHHRVNIQGISVVVSLTLEREIILALPRCSSSL